MGKLFIVSGLSGCGKSFLTDLIIKRIPSVKRLTTATTRSPRSEEEDGVNYIYLSRQEFEDRIQKKLFVEWAFVYENFYGTLRFSLDLELSLNRGVILIVDVQGAKTLKEQFPEAVSIFIDVESPEVAAKRIVARGNYPGELRQRITPTEKELLAAKNFDYRVINIDGTPEIAVEKICEIIECLLAF